MAIDSIRMCAAEPGYTEIVITNASTRPANELGLELRDRFGKEQEEVVVRPLPNRIKPGETVIARVHSAQLQESEPYIVSLLQLPDRKSVCNASFRPGNLPVEPLQACLSDDCTAICLYHSGRESKRDPSRVLTVNGAKVERTGAESLIAWDGGSLRVDRFEAPRKLLRDPFGVLELKFDEDDAESVQLLPLAPFVAAQLPSLSRMGILRIKESESHYSFFLVLDNDGEKNEIVIRKVFCDGVDVTEGLNVFDARLKYTQGPYYESVTELRLNKAVVPSGGQSFRFDYDVVTRSGGVASIVAHGSVPFSMIPDVEYVMLTDIGFPYLTIASPVKDDLVSPGRLSEESQAVRRKCPSLPLFGWHYGGSATKEVNLKSRFCDIPCFADKRCIDKNLAYAKAFSVPDFKDRQTIGICGVRSQAPNDGSQELWWKTLFWLSNGCRGLVFDLRESSSRDSQLLDTASDINQAIGRLQPHMSSGVSLQDMFRSSTEGVALNARICGPDLILIFYVNEWCSGFANHASSKWRSVPRVNVTISTPSDLSGNYTAVDLMSGRLLSFAPLRDGSAISLPGFSLGGCVALVRKENESLMAMCRRTLRFSRFPARPADACLELLSSPAVELDGIARVGEARFVVHVRNVGSKPISIVGNRLPCSGDLSVRTTGGIIKEGEAKGITFFAKCVKPQSRMHAEFEFPADGQGETIPMFVSAKFTGLPDAEPSLVDVGDIGIGGDWRKAAFILKGNFLGHQLSVEPSGNPFLEYGQHSIRKHEDSTTIEVPIRGKVAGRFASTITIRDRTLDSQSIARIVGVVSPSISVKPSAIVVASVNSLVRREALLQAVDSPFLDIETLRSDVDWIQVVAKKGIGKAATRISIEIQPPGYPTEGRLSYVASTQGGKHVGHIAVSCLGNSMEQ